jgi:hypothetical protein
MDIVKENVVGTDFAYTFHFDEENFIFMEGYWHEDVAQPGFEVMLYDGDSEREICILEGDKEIKPRHDTDAWLIIKNNAHILVRNIWKLG